MSNSCETTTAAAANLSSEIELVATRNSSTRVEGRSASSHHAGGGVSSFQDEHVDNEHDNSDLLTMVQAAALLTADCLGTGLLALPQNIQVLGTVVGLGFLVACLPINLYAGTILSNAALNIESRNNNENDFEEEEIENHQGGGGDGIMITSRKRKKNKKAYASVVQDSQDTTTAVMDTSMDEPSATDKNQKQNIGDQKGLAVRGGVAERKTHGKAYLGLQQQQQQSDDETKVETAAAHSGNVLLHQQQQDMKDGNLGTPPAGPDAAAGLPLHDSETHPQVPDGLFHTSLDTQPSLPIDATHDYIAMTQAAFQPTHGSYVATATYIVMAVYYTNIFLVLGDYILVMSHAVAAMISEDVICLPTAGILASTLMFGFSQLRTMSHLGHSVTFLSLTCLAVVVVQCLYFGEHNNETNTTTLDSSETTLLRKFSALASIGFATGANKLLLNIRNEMKHREQAPYTLATSLTVFGSVYVAICVLAGPNPPSFLFDSIPSGPHRRVAGLLLWIHVAVSYAINSQAICSSMDRLFFHHLSVWNLNQHAKRRWLLLTLLLTISSYLVANVVPFFKDLVALIGALTAVPLTLTIPALLHRRIQQMPLWCPTRHSLCSFALLVFSLIFLGIGLAGSLESIESDWTHRAGPFSCTV